MDRVSIGSYQTLSVSPQQPSGLDTLYNQTSAPPALPHVHVSSSQAGNMEWMEKYGLEQLVALVPLKTPLPEPPSSWNTPLTAAFCWFFFFFLLCSASTTCSRAAWTLSAFHGEEFENVSAQTGGLWSLSLLFTRQC